MINKNFRFSKHYILETCNQHLIELILFPPPNTIKVIREFERIQKKIYRQKMSIMFNIYIYIYIYIYKYMKMAISRWTLTVFTSKNYTSNILINNLFNLEKVYKMLVWFGWFYGISTFVGYLTPNPFLCK